MTQLSDSTVAGNTALLVGGIGQTVTLDDSTISPYARDDGGSGCGSRIGGPLPVPLAIAETVASG